MDEMRWTMAEVTALRDQVLAFWSEWGALADESFAAWRAEHPEARLC
jgi:hypothetical protein